MVKYTVPEPEDFIRDEEDLIDFLWANDGGATKEEIMNGCQWLIEYYIRLEKYELCAIIRDFVNLVLIK